MSCCGGCGDTTLHQGVITFQGKPMPLEGTINRIGLEAPDFTVVGNDLAPAKLSDFKCKKVLISVVPSLDTGVCDMQTRRFNTEASKLPGVQVLTISMDLPLAPARWFGAAGVSNLAPVCEHRCADFGLRYGLLTRELCPLTRARLAASVNRLPFPPYSLP